MKSETKRFNLDPALALLLLTAFFCPIFGGYIVSDATTLNSGIGAAIAAALGGSDAPVLGHALYALPMIVAVVLALIKRRVQQVPKQAFSTVWMLFFVFLGFSIVLSSFRILSVTLWLEWLCYAVALFSAVSIGGRKFGPLALACAVLAGCSWVAVKSVMEYGANRADDPSWRVYGGWVNPNATGAMLLMGLFIGLGICLSKSRANSLIAGIATVLCAFAIILTGSKGAVSLALPIGIIAFGTFQVRDAKKLIPLVVVAVLLGLVIGVLFLKNVGWVGLGLSGAYLIAVLVAIEKQQIAGARFAGIFAASCTLVLLLAVTSPKSAAVMPTPMTRVGSGSQTQEQSSEFRVNLWKSALYLIEKKPFTGFGLGTYRNESGRLGLTTTTLFAHNVYLQILAESGIIPFLLLVAGLGLWFAGVAKSRSALPSDNLYLLASVVASIVAILAHSLVDSDLYYFGIGITFFLLLGIGLSLSSDSVAPELIQKPIRIAATAAVIGIAGLLLIGGWGDTLKSVVRKDVQATDAEAAKSDIESLGWLTGFDGDALYLKSTVEPPSDKITTLKAAYALAPTEKIARALAKVQIGEHQYTEAESSLEQGLRSDPSNLLTLYLLMEVQRDYGDTEGAIKTANRLVQVESTPYFKVRSIPESIPTETYDARLEVLAPSAKTNQERAGYLADAVRGYLEYGKMKLTHQKIFAKQQGNDPKFRMPGYDSLEEANSKLAIAVNAAKEAAQLYREVGDSTRAAEMDADGKTLAAELAA